MAERRLAVVQTAGLCKTFRDFWRRPRVEAVKDLNLEIKPGEVFGLLGPNGSGKTTTIKMLLGLLYPSKGRISLFGKAPTDVSVKAKIGFLPEESYLYRFLVARETLDYYGRLFRLPKRVREERTERLLDMVGLRHEARRPIGEYSKGMARRIGLAQALINDPEFLILDEPTSGLDPIGARQIKDVIRDLGRKGKTILLSSHMLADVEDVCDRVVILYGGQQMAAGDIGDLLAQRNRTQLTLPAVSEATIDKIRDVLASAEQKEILDVTHPRQRLESFFLKIVEDAQKSNIRTSGVREAGAVPEFLKKATETTTQEIVGSLVEAASLEPKPLPMTEPIPLSAKPDTEPSREVIAELLGKAEPKDHEDTGGMGSPAELKPPPKPDADHSRPPTVADDAVIDSLIERADDESAGHSDTPSEGSP